jgi:GntR family transcriptional regulator
MPIRASDINLNKSTPVPLYFQLKQQVLERILSGTLSVDEQIPNELELGQALGVSRSTVRQAVSELVSEGYLHRVKAKGTFVSRPKVDEGFLQKLESFNSEMTQKGLRPSTKVLAQKAEPGPDKINRRLGIPPGSPVIYLCRLRYADGEPVVYLETYLPYDRYACLLEEDFSEQSLYSLLECKYNARVVKAVREIEAVPATPMEARFLNIPRNAAVCLVKTLAYTAGDVPVEYSVARYRGDRNKFSVELIRK